MDGEVPVEGVLAGRLPMPSALSTASFSPSREKVNEMAPTMLGNVSTR